jgi:hypothetical protein
MPQINSGKSPPWVSGEIVTAAGLNGMIDSATLDPSAITAQTNLATLTGDEYSLIVDTAGVLKKTQLKNIGDAGTDIKTDNIFGSTINGTLIIQPNGTTSSLNLQGGSAGATGIISLYSKDVSISAVASLDSSGTLTVVSGTGGTTFTSGGTTLFNSKVSFNATSSLGLPVGTTAQRPATPATGDTRFNTTTAKLEFYNGTSWISLNEVNTGTYSLYEIFEEAIPYSGSGSFFTSSTFTKPSNEIWEFRVELRTPQGYTNGGSFGWYKWYINGSVVRDFYTSDQNSTWIVGAGTALTSTSLLIAHHTWSIANWGGFNGDKFRIYKYKPTIA